MTPSELKYHVEQSGHERHFFDRRTMRFFGDTMRNYGVRSAIVKTNYPNGEYSETPVEVECWELYRRRAVKNGNKASAYFAKSDYRRIHEV